MSITVGELMESFENLKNETIANSEANIADIVLSIMYVNLLEQWPKTQIPWKKWQYIIPENAKVKKKTLVSISEMCEKVLYIWKIRANYKELLEKNDRIVFDGLIDLYDTNWIQAMIDEARKLWIYKWVWSNSMLVWLINWLIWWFNPEEIMLRELNKNGFDLSSNTLLETTDLFNQFLNKFNFMILWLINWKKDLHLGAINNTIN